jgi:hypothetical protein
MSEVTFKPNETNGGAFLMEEDGEQLGELVVGINNNTLTAYHTEVAPKAEGKGYAKKLLNAMVDYAREHHMQVVPLCPFVQAQFRRHPADYADIWKENKPNS